MVRITRKDVRKSRKEKTMSSVAEAHDIAQRVWDTKRTGSVKASVTAIKKFIEKRLSDEYLEKRPFTYRRAETIWQGSLKRVDPEELDALRQAEIEEAWNEHRTITARLVELNAIIADADKAYHRQALAEEG